MTLASPRYELLVSPRQAVEHAAAHLPAELGALMRFRPHFDPCCFYVDYHATHSPQDVPTIPARSMLVLAWHDRGGARLEIVRRFESVPRTPAQNALLAVGGGLPFAVLAHPVLLLLIPFLYVILDLSRSTPAERKLQDQLDVEVFAALDRAFAPIRRTGLPYREPAPLPAASAPDEPAAPAASARAADNRSS